MADTSPSETPTMPSPLRCLLGSIVAGGIAYLLYKLTTQIALGFAAKGLPTSSVATANIAVAVRTLVIGMSALGTGIFGLAAIGLLGLGIQLLIRKPKTE